MTHDKVTVRIEVRLIGDRDEAEGAYGDALVLLTEVKTGERVGDVLSKTERAQAAYDLAETALALALHYGWVSSGPTCNRCGGPGPVYYDTGTAKHEYACRGCHSRPDDPFFDPFFTQ